MQASVAVSIDGADWILVNATSDVRRQLERLPAPSGDSPRATPVSAVILTDANIDHAAGLLEFRQAPSLRIYSSAIVRDVLAGANSVFAMFARDERSWSVFDTSDGSTDLPEIIPGLHVRALSVAGLLPSFAGGSEASGAATALVFEDWIGGNRRANVVYAPIFLRAPCALLDAADAADAVFLDGSFWSDDELPALGLGARTAHDMGHAPIGGPDGWLSAFAGRRVGAHRYCIHINNSNPVLDPASTAARQLREAGFAPVDDGTELHFDGS